MSRHTTHTRMGGANADMSSIGIDSRELAAQMKDIERNASAKAKGGSSGPDPWMKDGLITGPQKKFDVDDVMSTYRSL